MHRSFWLGFALVALALGCGGNAPVQSAPPVPPTTRPQNAPTATAHVSSEAIDDPEQVAPVPSAPRVVGYFTNWAHYRKAPCAFRTEDVPVELLTHVNYAFASVLASEDRKTFELGPSSPDDQAKLYAEVAALKQKKPSLRTLLSVGGWAFNDEPTAWIFSAMAETPESRGHFIRQATEYLRRYDFDGLDIDWEFPAAAERGGRPIDTANFTSLLRELRAHFHAEAAASGKPELLLTIASPAGYAFYKLQEMAKLHESLDWINVMTYDYHGDWDHVVGDNAPLSDRGPDIEESIAGYVAMGVPRGKLVLGFATYARGFGGVSRDVRGAKSSAAGPVSPCGTDSLGSHHVAEWVKAGSYRRVWDETTQSAHAYDAKHGFWISYEDAQSYAQKLDFLEREGLGGGMFWAIDLDDIARGYPLIRQVSTRLLAPSATATPVVAAPVAAVP